MKYAVYIASKGRPNRQVTRNFLNARGIPNTVVVEPSEVQAYQEKVQGDFLVLDKCNQGVSYARNAIIEDAIRNDVDLLCYFDDDLTLYRTVKMYSAKGFTGRWRERITPNMFNELCRWAWNSEFFAVAFSTEALSFYQEHEVILCSMFCGGYLLKLKDLKRTGIRFDTSLKLFEDVDFSLHCLCAGLKTCTLSTFSIMTPSYGTSTGGLELEYRNKDKQARYTIEVYERWKDFVRINYSRSGRTTLTVDRTYFRERFGLPSDKEYEKTHYIVGQ